MGLHKINLQNLVAGIDPIDLIHQLFEQSFDAVFLLAGDLEDLHFVYANHATLRLTGYSREEIIDMPAKRLIGEKPSSSLLTE